MTEPGTTPPDAASPPFGAQPPDAVSGGFRDAPREAARAFRAAMEAMARPGTVRRVTGAAPPAPLSPAMGALILTLCDEGAPLHLAGALDAASVRAWVAFHAGARLVGRAECAFAAGAWEALMPLGGYGIGTPERPDRGATLIAEVPALADPALEDAGLGAEGFSLTGPGIASEARLSLPEGLVAARAALGAPYPTGLDILLCAGERVAALPRTTRVTALPRTIGVAALPRMAEVAAPPRATKVAGDGSEDRARRRPERGPASLAGAWDAARRAAQPGSAPEAPGHETASWTPTLRRGPASPAGAR